MSKSGLGKGCSMFAVRARNSSPCISKKAACRRFTRTASRCRVLTSIFTEKKAVSVFTSQ